jgi:hypothetical protein
MQWMPIERPGLDQKRHQIIPIKKKNDPSILRLRRAPGLPRTARHQLKQYPAHVRRDKNRIVTKVLGYKWHGQHRGPLYAYTLHLSNAFKTRADRAGCEAEPWAIHDITTFFMEINLFRPVGLYELALMWDRKMREFPPRLAHQPIFYPVAIAEYARQIARDWNTSDEKSGFGGFVTAFSVDVNYLSKFEQRKVGSAQHIEYWIPAEDLNSFNKAICRQISLVEGYFGPNFTGHAPASGKLGGKDAVAQFLYLTKTLREAGSHSELFFDTKAIFLNWLFWRRYDFSGYGVSYPQRDLVLDATKRRWELARIEVRLP